MRCEHLLRPALVSAALAAILGVSECPGDPDVDCAADPENPACVEEDPCAAECQAQSQDLLLDCLAAGGRFAACDVQAQEAVAVCLEQACGEDVEPTPALLPCDEQCRNAGEAALDACRAEGNPDELCYGLQNDAEAECAETCVDPVPPSCGETCEASARAEFDACMAEGAPDMECEERYQASLAACTSACDGPPPEESCELACESDTQNAFDLCLAEGGVEEECQRAAAEQLETCQATCSSPEPPSCADGCTEQARASFEACLESGGGEEDCKTQAQAEEASCQAACSGAEPTPEPDADPAPEPTPEPLSCEAACESEAQGALEACLAGGQPDTVCQEEVFEPALSKCLGACPTPAPDPLSCDDICVEQSTEIFESCMLDGGTDPECAALAGQDMDACLAECAGT